MLIRIEAAQDAESGRYYVEIYYPPDAPQPLVTTAPRYASAAAAERDAIAVIAAGISAGGASSATPD